MKFSGAILKTNIKKKLNFYLTAKLEKKKFQQFSKINELKIFSLQQLKCACHLENHSKRMTHILSPLMSGKNLRVAWIFKADLSLVFSLQWIILTCRFI